MDFFRYVFNAKTFTNSDWMPYLIGGLCFALVFVFQAVALYTIAGREGYKNKWMAFIPFFNTYYIGVCAQKNKFYNVSAKTIGLAAAIVEAVLVALYIFILIAENLLKSGNYLVTEVEVYFGASFETYVVSDNVPDNLKWAAWVYNYMDTYIVGILRLVFFVLEIILLICFFQTYACRRYVIFSITSVLFPIMGILFFIVRNNKGINYRDFIRAEQARQYQQYQQYRQQNYNNPYNQNYNQNPYNRNPYNNNTNSGSGSDPFDGFGGNANGNGNSGNTPQDDPFNDFDKQ